MPPTEYGKLLIAMLAVRVSRGLLSPKDRAELAESWFAEHDPAFYRVKR